jgi:hypothetical protein
LNKLFQGNPQVTSGPQDGALRYSAVGFWLPPVFPHNPVPASIHSVYSQQRYHAPNALMDLLWRGTHGMVQEQWRLSKPDSFLR